MQDELLKLVTIAVVLAPIVSGFTQIYKMYTSASGKLLPLLAVLTGILLSIAWALVFNHNSDIGVYALSGVLSGLSSVGVYQLAKKEEK